MCVCVCVPSFSHPFDEGDQAVEMGAKSFQLYPLPGLEPQASSRGADVWGLGASWPSKGGQIHQSPVHVREAKEPLRAQGREEKRSLVPLWPDAAPDSTWGLPRRHRREVILGPGKTHEPRV